MKAVLLRELRAYFLTPVGYIFCGLYLLLSGIFFTAGNLFSREPHYSYFLYNVLFVFLLVVPVLTMRLLSEEKKQKTDQLLLTSPLKIIDIILGKYFAAVLLFLIVMVVTFLYPLLLSFHGEIDVSESIGAYIGFILIGVSYISIGLFVSSITENQVIASFVTFCLLLLIWLLPSIGSIIPTDPAAGLLFLIMLLTVLCLWLFISMKNLLIIILTAATGLTVLLFVFFTSREFFIALIPTILRWFSLNDRYFGFARGLITLADTVYYLSFSAFFVFLTYRAIEKNRWM